MSDAANLKAVPSQSSGSMRIRFEVNVNYSSVIPACNTYLVEVIDGNGRLVGEPQLLASGINTYNFYETASGSGIRTARIITQPNENHIICSTELVTAPVTMNGPFEKGRSYSFDLYPQANPPEAVE